MSSFESNLQYQPTLLGAVWRYRWMVLAAVVVGIVIGLGFVAVQPIVYSATTTIEIRDAGSEGLFEDATASNQQAIRDRVDIIGSDAVAQRTLELIQVQNPDVVLSVSGILSNSRISGTTNSDLIDITFVSEDAGLAVLVSNSVAFAYEDIVQAEADRIASEAINRIDSALGTIDTQLDEIQGQIAEIRAQDNALRELEDQAADAKTELSSLQAQLARSTDEERNSEIRTRINDIQRQLNILVDARAVTSDTPELAALLREQTAAVNRRAALSSRRTEIDLESRLAGSGISILAPAQRAASSRGAGTERVVAVSVIIFGLAAAALAYFLASRRGSIVDRSQPGTLLNAPLLAEVPNFAEEGISSSLPVWEEARSASAEAFRFAAVSLDLRGTAAGYRSLAVISPTQGNGKTTVVANAAVAAAREGSRVLVIDADFGNQALSRQLLRAGDVTDRVGITDLASDRTVEDLIMQIALGEGTYLSLLSRGTRPVIAADFFRSRDAQAALEEVKELFDLVLIDAPPLLQVAYASTLVDYSDAAVVVVEHDSPQAEVLGLANRMELIGKPIVGYVYNKAPLRRQMTETQGSMADILGDQSVATPRRRRARR